MSRCRAAARLPGVPKTSKLDGAAGTQVAADVETLPADPPARSIRASARMKSTTKSAPHDPASTGNGAASASCRWSARSRRRRPVTGFPPPTSPCRRRDRPASSPGAPAGLAGEDKVLTARTTSSAPRSASPAATARQHPLVRLGNAGMTRVGDGKPLDVEMLTQWLAERSGLPYLRIDPLKVDVGQVAERDVVTTPSGTRCCRCRWHATR